MSSSCGSRRTCGDLLKSSRSRARRRIACCVRHELAFDETHGASTTRGSSSLRAWF